MTTMLRVGSLQLNPRIYAWWHTKILAPYHLENTLFISFTVMVMGLKRVLSLHIEGLC